MKFKEYIRESMQRHMALYKAKNGKWYLELAANEYGEQHEADLYGPFATEKAADAYLNNFSNPGGGGYDDGGKQPVPKSAPNGSKIINPKSAAQNRPWY